jgi:hypothetical protein
LRGHRERQWGSDHWRNQRRRGDWRDYIYEREPLGVAVTTVGTEGASCVSEAACSCPQQGGAGTPPLGEISVSL